MATISKKDVLDAISEMSVMDVVELIKDMEEKFGVSAAAAAVQIAAPAQGQAADASAEEKTEFNVILTNFGSNKVAVIKVVRELTGLGLKEAKDLVEGVPSSIKESIAKGEAETIKKQLEEVGASVEIK